MSFENMNAIRGHAVKSIPYNFDLTPDPPNRKPVEKYMIPDDRGSLVGVGTTRLPVQRHRCAKVLWDFFGALGDCEVSTVDDGTPNRCLSKRVRAFTQLQNYLNPAINDPSYRAIQLFAHAHTVLRFWNIKRYVSTFVGTLAMTEKYLITVPVRPKELDQGYWINELREKKASKWIMRLDEQLKVSVGRRKRADELYLAGDLDNSAWYYYRALIDVCPWLPTEWYMSTKEAEQMKDIQSLWHCVMRLAEFALDRGHAVLCINLAALCSSHPFVPDKLRLEAARLQLKAMEPIHWDRWEKTQPWRRDKEHRYVWTQEPLVINFEVYDKDPNATMPAPLFSRPNFDPLDGIRWQDSVLDQKKTFDKAFYDATGRAGMVYIMLQAWKAKYGDKRPYCWDMTEDETLGEELGKESDWVHTVER